MLAPKNRLTASSDIKKVVTQSVPLRKKCVNVYFLPSSIGNPRFACVAGKKVHQSAVVRHSIQRKIRAACRIVVTAFHGSYDIVVVVVTPSIRSMSVQEVANEITSALPSV